MPKTSVFRVLSSFSREEMKKFRGFLESPYFNKSKKLVEFYNLVKKYYPLFTDIRLEKEAIAKKLYAGEEYRDSTIRNLFSDLHAKAIEFLTYENFNRSKTDKYKYLLNEIGRKNIKNEFERTVETFNSDENAGENAGVDYTYFLNNHYMEAYKFNFFYTNERVLRKEAVDTETEFLNNSTRHLLYYFLTELGTHNVSQLIYAKTYNIDTSDTLLKILSEKFSFERIEEIIPVTDKYFYIIEIYKALTGMYSDTDNEKNYFEYRRLLFTHVSKLSPSERNLHLRYLSSYCIGKAQQKHNPVFNDELFELYEVILKNEYYIDNKTEHLPHEMFRSIILHGLRLKKYSWTADFIVTYSGKVHPDDRHNMFHLGSAYLHYHQGNYSEALEKLNRIETDFFIFKFDVKNLTLMIYYELGYFEEALCLIKTYHEFLRKNRLISVERKKRYFSFIKFMEKLINIKLGAENTDLGYLKHRINKHPHTAFKPWLQEKILQLQTRIKNIA